LFGIVEARLRHTRDGSAIKSAQCGGFTDTTAFKRSLGQRFPVRRILRLALLPPGIIDAIRRPTAMTRVVLMRPFAARRAFNGNPPPPITTDAVNEVRPVRRIAAISSLQEQSNVARSISHAR
jgi:hypothetical protein